MFLIHCSKCNRNDEESPKTSAAEGSDVITHLFSGLWVLDGVFLLPALLMPALLRALLLLPSALH